MRTVEVLEGALGRFGVDGEFWRKYPVGGSPLHCCVTSLADSPFCDGYISARKLFERVIGTEMVSWWNDSPDRTWPEVKSAFLKAIELAKSEAGQ